MSIVLMKQNERVLPGEMCTDCLQLLTNRVFIISPNKLAETMGGMKTTNTHRGDR